MEDVEILEKRLKRRIAISKMLSDFLYAPIPPVLDNIKEMARSMHVYECEDDWNNNIFALIMSVMLKGIKTGDYRVLQFLYEITEGKGTEMKEEVKSSNVAFESLIKAITDVKELPEGD